MTHAQDSDAPRSPLPDSGHSETPAAEWTDHEHAAEQVLLEAQKLVGQAGSPELAKQAIDIIQKCQQMPVTAPDDVVTQSNRNSLERKDEFLKALERFEKSLETPVIPGELSDWLVSAKQFCDHVGVLLGQSVQHQHVDLYTRMSREDPELSSQVEKLRATDEQLLVDFENVNVSLASLCDKAHAVEPNELKLAHPLEDVVKQALSFVIHARTQETAITSWFVEAFNRDRGVGD